MTMIVAASISIFTIWVIVKDRTNRGDQVNVITRTNGNGRPG